MVEKILILPRKENKIFKNLKRVLKHYLLTNKYYNRNLKNSKSKDNKKAYKTDNKVKREQHSCKNPSVFTRSR